MEHAGPRTQAHFPGAADRRESPAELQGGAVNAFPRFPSAGRQPLQEGDHAQEVGGDLLHPRLRNQAKTAAAASISSAVAATNLDVQACLMSIPCRTVR